MDNSKHPADLPTLDKQDALMADEHEVLAAKPVVAAVPTVDSDTLLVVKEDEGWYFEVAVGLDG